MLSRSVIAVAVTFTFIAACETSKPTGGPERTSASTPVAADEGGTKTNVKAPAQPPPAAAASSCGPLIEHVTKLLFERAATMPEEQRKAAEQNKPQIKAQLAQACADRWTEEFKSCAAKAKTEPDINTCARAHAPKPPANRPPPPARPPNEAANECAKVAAHVISVAAKSSNPIAKDPRALAMLRVQIATECSSAKMPANVRACLLKAQTEAQMKKCAPMLLTPPK